MILRGLLLHYSAPTAIIASALLFGLVHLNPWQAVGAVALGVLFGWWYVRTRSLTLCIFGHAVNNLIAVLLFRFGDWEPVSNIFGPPDFVGTAAAVGCRRGFAVGCRRPMAHAPHPRRATGPQPAAISLARARGR